MSRVILEEVRTILSNVEQELSHTGRASPRIRRAIDAIGGLIVRSNENSVMLDWMIKHRHVSVQYWDGDRERGWFVFFSDGISPHRTITHSHPTARAAIKAAMKLLP